MAKKEEGLCVGESNREWQETAPCNEIQTVAIYSTHFSLQATTGKLQYKNIWYKNQIQKQTLMQAHYNHNQFSQTEYLSQARNGFKRLPPRLT